jgi:signal recognition particle subunit SRP54
MLKEICKALMESDINIRLIQGLRKNVKESINLDENTGAVNKKRNIQKVHTQCLKKATTILC